MKNTLILFIAIVNVACISVYAQTTNETVTYAYRQTGDKIEKLKVYTTAVTFSDTSSVGLDSIPAVLDTQYAIQIMNAGSGNVFVNYKPVWYKNPVWFLYRSIKLRYDAYSFGNGLWQVQYGEDIVTGNLLSFWFTLLAWGGFLGPIVVFFLSLLIGILFPKTNTVAKMRRCILGIVWSIFVSYIYIQGNYFVDSYRVYNLGLSKMDVYKHFILLPFLILSIFYMGWALWKIAVARERQSDSSDIEVVPEIE